MSGAILLAIVVMGAVFARIFARIG